MRAREGRPGEGTGPYMYGRREGMVYKIRRAKIDDEGNVHVVGKRAGTYITPQALNIGGLYFLRKNQLFRVEREL